MPSFHSWPEPFISSHCLKSHCLHYSMGTVPLSCCPDGKTKFRSPGETRITSPSPRPDVGPSAPRVRTSWGEVPDPELALRCHRAPEPSEPNRPLQGWDPHWTPSLLNKLRMVERGPSSSKLTVSPVKFGCHWRTLLRKTTAAWLGQ